MFKTSEIVKNHKNNKNIYIIRIYSSFDENKRILNSLSDIPIKGWMAGDKITNARDESISLIEFMNGKRFF